METMKYKKQVEKWDVFEVEFQGPATGNPFTDYEVTGTFESKMSAQKPTAFTTGKASINCGLCPLLRRNIPSGSTRDS